METKNTTKPSRNKFIECPHCSTMNKANFFIFNKKHINCANCNEDIDVKAARLITRTCIHCGNVIIYDQLKKRHECPICHGNLNGKICPVCKEPLAFELSKGYFCPNENCKNHNGSVVQGKMVSLICPQCSCVIQADEMDKSATCPVCDYELDVAREMAKDKLVSTTGVNVIKYEGDNHTFIWKHPIEDFNTGSQLLVHESQEAIFILNGQALDTFGPGRYTLETESIPELKKLYSLPTGKVSPFHAEVYFINKTVQMNLKWGTDSRVRFIEPETHLPLDIGASGDLNLQVSDGRRLLIKLVGTGSGIKREDILRYSDRVEDLPNEFDDDKINKLEKVDKLDTRREGVDKYSQERSGGWSSILKGFFRPLILTEVKSHLSAAIADNRINIFEIDRHLKTFSESLRDLISPGFEEYGLTVPQFYVENVSLPEDDPNFKQWKKMVTDRYFLIEQQRLAADVKRAQLDVLVQENEAKRRQAQTMAEIKMMNANADAAAIEATGLAQAKVMAAKGYSEKDVLDADVRKEQAKAMGQMGANGGSATGGIVNEAVNFGVGMAMAGQAVNAVKEMTGGMQEAMWKCTCGYTNKGDTKFCGACGSQRGGTDSWTCPTCGKMVSGAIYCGSCGTKKNDPMQHGWHCQSCGNHVADGMFCGKCGAKKPESDATWICESCGKQGNTGNFCNACGNPKTKGTWICSCGTTNTDKFCSKCGKKK